MFWKKKTAANRYIVAVKNYNDTVENLKNGTLTLPYEREIYLKMIETQSSKVDSLKEVRKFARTNGKSYKEVSHYWEGLIVDGYTLINVEYVEKIPALDHVCRNDYFKFVCVA